MSQTPKSKNRTQSFGILFAITTAVWLLRGFGILTFIPGGIIWLLLLLTIGVGLLSRLRRW